MFLSSRSPRDNTIYSWNSHSSAVNKRWVAVHGEPRRIPNRNWAAVQGPIPSTIDLRGRQGPPRPVGQGVAVVWRVEVAVWEGIHLGWSWWTLVGSSRLPRPRQRRRFLSPGTCRASALLSEPPFPTLQWEVPGPADPAGPSLSELLCRAEQKDPAVQGGCAGLRSHQTHYLYSSRCPPRADGRDPAKGQLWL